jgi:hypothetical protein
VEVATIQNRRIKRKPPKNRKRRTRVVRNLRSLPEVRMRRMKRNRRALMLILTRTQKQRRSSLSSENTLATQTILSLFFTPRFLWPYSGCFTKRPSWPSSMASKCKISCTIFCSHWSSLPLRLSSIFASSTSWSGTTICPFMIISITWLIGSKRERPDGRGASLS